MHKSGFIIKLLIENSQGQLLSEIGAQRAQANVREESIISTLDVFLMSFPLTQSKLDDYLGKHLV